tara:strand:- start:101 stop:790 length:690 start_codon:yes stop_codon:yes gene_type:complete
MEEVIIIKNPTKYDKIRLGKNHDGGYVIMDGLEYNLLIGCGIACDISFEDDFLEKYKHQDVWCVALDGTINDIPNCRHRQRIQFQKSNIKGNNITNLLNFGESIFLKMDIEGSEYKFFDEISEKELNNISQMVVEFHSKISVCPDGWENYKINCIKKILKTHDMVHFHANNYVTVKDNIPKVFEATFVHKKYIKDDYKLNDKPLPTSIDHANNSSVPDHILKGFPYQRD